MTEQTVIAPLSATAKTLYAADIYAMQYRLSRCLQATIPLLTSTSVEAGTAAAASSSSPSPPLSALTPRASVVARHVRRLGELLREAKQLSARVAASSEPSKDPTTLADVQGVEGHHVAAEDAALRVYYNQQLQARFAQLQQDMTTSEHLLRARLAATPGLRGLPVNCVGTTPRELCVCANDGSTEMCYVYTDALTPAAARLPVPTVHCIESRDGVTAMPGSSAPSAAIKSVKETSAGTTTQAPLSTTALPDNKPEAPATAEDRIMADIQQAIHQMKDGALQMSALMAQEKSQLQSAAALLSGGVAQTHANMKELDKVSYVAAAGRVPWLLSFVPGMPIVWRTVLQPLWAVVKQVLLMASILALTGCVLLLISVVPKPVRFRGQRPDRNVPPALSTQADAAAPSLRNTLNAAGSNTPVFRQVAEKAAKEHKSHQYLPEEVETADAAAEPHAPTHNVVEEQEQQPEHFADAAEPHAPTHNVVEEEEQQPEHFAGAAEPHASTHNVVEEEEQQPEHFANAAEPHAPTHNNVEVKQFLADEDSLAEDKVEELTVRTAGNFPNGEDLLDWAHEVEDDL